MLRIPTVPAALAPRVAELRDRWRRTHGLRTLYLGSAIIGVGYPAAYVMYLPLQATPDRHLFLHVLVGLVAWLVFAATALSPQLQRAGWRLHPIAGTTMLLATGVIVVDTHQAAPYLAGLLLIVFALPMFYVSLRQLAIVYGVTYVAALGYAAVRHDLDAPALTAFAIYALADGIALASMAAWSATKLAELTEHARVEALTAADIERLLLRDAVTDLPNAVALERAFPATLRQHGALAIVTLELDRPDLVAGRIGARRMDALISVAAKRIAAAVPDGAAVYRLRDAAFSAVVPGLDRGAAERLAANLAAAVAAPFDDVARTAFVTATVAVACPPDDGTDAASLLAVADERLIAARRRREAAAGGDDVDLEYASRLAGDFPGALERNEFVLHFQPYVRAADGVAIGVEALVRWQHPELGLLFPDAFIDIAEREGLIVPLGEWVMRESARIASVLAERGTPLDVAFNVSARQFRDVAFIERLCEAVAGIGWGMLTMELTESTAMDRTGQSQDVLDRCAASGVRVALDDFGTGYSSLAYLKHFPIDTVKIDRTFVAGLPHDDSDVAIARAIIALARAIDCTVQAEGVETAEQAGWLRDEGCHRLQGYFVARPMPFDALEHWLALSRAAAAPAPAR